MSAPMATTATSKSATEICVQRVAIGGVERHRVRDERRDPLHRPLVQVDARHLAVQLGEGGCDGGAEASETDHEDLSFSSQ